jgi:serine/threonine protein kinase/formylglycine-generating enzyme required for sulfatase activity/tetratricopeptide (TPR) repeat protein
MLDPVSEKVVSLDAAISQIADRFARELRGGAKPRIEDVLSSEASELHPHLLGKLLALELEHRRSDGEQPAIEEYLQRFPSDQKLVEAVILGADFDAFATTALDQANPTSDGAAPTKLGRYLIKRPLGQGGFGVVYLAHDPQLDRPVALKVPRRSQFQDSDQVASFVKEARTAAKLKHSSLVAVYDVQEEAGLPFIVQEYIDGDNLGDWAIKQQPSFSQIAKIVTCIADAIGYLHQRGLTHCDLKLANVLMDSSGQPHVADFGLALHESTQSPMKGKIFGTPAMMAPEQVRGEGHRLDGRTDIWAVGIMLYQLLAGRHPFVSTNQQDLFHEIQSHDPKPMRQIDRGIPRELERICLKCLSKRRTERYPSAADLQEDLDVWLTEASSSQIPQAATIANATDSTLPVPDSSANSLVPVKIIPKGLRSFDAEDTDFFLELLPGPRDREGLPESIRFWKNRIEEPDPDKTFSVGLLYGPSGCGKSSLVKAGLLTRLSDQVLAIYVEATPDETELRILKQFRKHIPRLPENISLPDACAELRQSGAGRDRKVLLVIDQFEQWLHTHTDVSLTALAGGLRQCDGGRLQVILLVRDDFFASVNRLFRELEEPLVEGRNYALVDRFDRQHACKVLTAFGRAYGKLGDEMSESQTQFIAQGVEELAEEDKVISVRLSLFADMMKLREWTSKSLNEMGGASGVGVTFLEETFSSKTAPPTHREHESAIRQVLAALLPESGTDIKGSMRSADALRQAAGYGADQRRFDELLRILDSELRIITPTDPEGIEKEEVRSQKGEERASTSSFNLHSSHFYQLTHDYLVPSLREWLTRKQRETSRGRAELKLEERSAVWNVNRENKQLPSTLEWLQIRWHSDRSKWSEPQRRMMRTAAKVHGITWGSTIAALLVVGLTIQYWVSQRDWNNKREQTRVAAESLQNNLGPSIPVNIRELKKLPESLVLEELTERFATNNPEHKLALAFALATYGRVETDFLVSRIDDIAGVDSANFVDALAVDRQPALTMLKAEANQCVSNTLWRRKAKLSIAALALGDAEIAVDMCQYENRPDPDQRTLFIHEFPLWDWLRPDRPFDLSRLAQLVADSQNSGLRSGILLAVGSIPKDQLQERNPAALESWSELAARWFLEHPDTSTHSAANWLLRQWEQPLPEVAVQTQFPHDRDWFLNSAGMTMLRIRPSAPEPVIRLADPVEVFRRQLPELRDLSKEQLSEQGSAAQLRKRAVAYFQTGDYEAALTDLESLLENPNLSDPGQLPIYRILALSHLGRHDDAATAYETASAALSRSLKLYLFIQMTAYRNETESALKLLGRAARVEPLTDGEFYDAACAAALCAKSVLKTDSTAFGQFKALAFELLEKAIRAGYSDGPHMSQDPDFSVLHSEPEFASLVRQIYKRADEVDLPTSEYWIARCEVTRGQFEAFMQDSDYNFEKPTDWEGVDSETSPTSDHPAHRVNWYDSVMYCNWLSRQEGKLPAYRKTGKKEKGGYDDTEYDQWEPVPGATGYRLLSESEWELACRAGSTSDWSSGSDEQLLVDYCQMYPSKLTAEVGSKLPNAWGLQDMHGNVYEWCEDLAGGSYRVYRGGSWDNDAAYCRMKLRYNFDPTYRAHNIGFRLALSSPSRVSSSAEQGQVAEPAGVGTEGASAEQRPEMP